MSTSSCSVLCRIGDIICRRAGVITLSAKRRGGVSRVLCLLWAGVEASGAGVLALGLEIRVGRGGVESSCCSVRDHLPSALDVEGCGVNCESLASSLLVMSENSLRKSCSDSIDVSRLEFLLGVSITGVTGDKFGAGHSFVLTLFLGTAALLSRRIMGGVDN